VRNKRNRAEQLVGIAVKETLKRNNKPPGPKTPLNLENIMTQGPPINNISLTVAIVLPDPFREMEYGKTPRRSSSRARFNVWTRDQRWKK